MHLRYDCYGAAMGSKETRHAQLVMRELGITYQHATPQSMGDQWWFWNCENVPETLPQFIKEVKLDPMKYIGWGLDEATARMLSGRRKRGGNGGTKAQGR